ncbi:PLP-dependent transferase [Aspergillus campestris IBT 28561]|uniref:Molybdenum cofactor sulfurase n=1 Tax=Aspergillus campestris (strain IBT 28561) TaxID=1392248 RepID=A0A2I1CRQ1_ASPC2|nr:PLP-dependent transferase [Aspergillus campestris IBT 28561]PKY00297.1 PLP-dependent transferase [Aspergillus campestris IBT 28561]
MTAQSNDSPYLDEVDSLREREYPLLSGTTYLDHAGTTPYPTSLITSFTADLTTSLYGNPHSLSSSSQLATQRIDDIRLRALRFFNADPEFFDLVFVPNATAGIKLVGDVLGDYSSRSSSDTISREESRNGFWYGYHVDAHTSLVGARELAAQSRCFETDDEVDGWIDSTLCNGDDEHPAQLFAFPAQSNMNGRRLVPARWCERIRRASQNGNNNRSGKRKVFTLLDAAALVSTSPLDLSDARTAPDFTVLSFYKIFGFPDLGALIVRKEDAVEDVLRARKFFGGGTVDMVLASAAEEGEWHAKKGAIHECLEDGTLPFHSIVALGAAMETHARLYGSMERVALHVRFLATQLAGRLSALRHWNGQPVCCLYGGADYGDSTRQGPIIALNLKNSQGAWIGKSEVERLAAVKNIQIRSGTLCNPGGTARSLGWSGSDMRRHFSAGLRCGDDHDIMDGRPTGILRVSLGAMSSLGDGDAFVDFVDEFYVEKDAHVASLTPPVQDVSPADFYIEALSVYPIKSCGAFKVPDGQRWTVKKEGLAWDREWCLIHQGTGATLNQKRYPRMALIKPDIDLARGILRIAAGDAVLEVSLDRGHTDDNPTCMTSLCQSASKPSTVCGDRVVVQAYTAPAVSAFFSSFLDVPCTLARFPPLSEKLGVGSGGGGRESALRAAQPGIGSMPGAFPDTTPTSSSPNPSQAGQPILLSNESPILLISRSSVNRLNEHIKLGSSPSTTSTTTRTTTTTTKPKAVPADVFRANILIAESSSPISSTRTENPYIEDTWNSFTVIPSSHHHTNHQSQQQQQQQREVQFNVLASCQRCQMVCVDQTTGIRGDEPYSTLVKTRKVGRGVFFGRHVSVDHSAGESSIMVGDGVRGGY